MITHFKITAQPYRSNVVSARIPLVPVPVSALVPEKNDKIIAIGAAAVAIGGVEAADSLGPL